MIDLDERVRELEVAIARIAPRLLEELEPEWEDALREWRR